MKRVLSGRYIRVLSWFMIFLIMAPLGAMPQNAWGQVQPIEAMPQNVRGGGSAHKLYERRA